MVHINSDDAERRAIRHARFEIVLSLVVESLHRAAQFQRVGGHITRQSGVVHLSGRHEKILLLIASANRDESRWERPDQLDITRRVAGQSRSEPTFMAVSVTWSPDSKAKRC